jgi:hypothetical protein
VISGFIRLVVAVGVIFAAISFAESSNSAWATVISDILGYMDAAASWVVNQFS